MIGEQLILKKPLTLTEVKNVLSKRKKEKELRYEQDLTLKYAKQFAKLTPAKASKLHEELMELDGMTPELASKVIDIFPVQLEILKLIPGKDIKVSEEILNKVLELMNKYAKDKIAPEIEREVKKEVPKIEEVKIGEEVPVAEAEKSSGIENT